MLVLGVDPGTTGAAALVNIATMRVIDVIDLPIIRQGKTVMVDGSVFSPWLMTTGATYAVIELVSTWSGKQGDRGTNPALQNAIASRIATMVRIAGGIESALSTAGIPFFHTAAHAWQRRAGLLKKGKEDNLALANSQLVWPPGSLCLKKHHNRADAALIAMYGKPPPAAPKAPRRSKLVEKKMAENVPPGTLFDFR